MQAQGQGFVKEFRPDLQGVHAAGYQLGNWYHLDTVQFIQNILSLEKRRQEEDFPIIPLEFDPIGFLECIVG